LQDKAPVVVDAIAGAFGRQAVAIHRNEEIVIRNDEFVVQQGCCSKGVHVPVFQLFCGTHIYLVTRFSDKNYVKAKSFLAEGAERKARARGKTKAKPVFARRARRPRRKAKGE
jgi:hypothetical protein